MQKQPKNTLFFFVVSALVMITWFSVIQPMIWPPPKREPRAPDAPKLVLPDARLWGGLGAQAVPTNAGLGDLARLAAVVAITDQSASGKRAAPAVAVRPSSPFKRRTAGQLREDAVDIGDDASHLKAVLDRQGGGVRSITLNHFQEADDQGLPVWLDPETRKRPKPLELIPAEHNTLTPSNLLYHYNPNRKNDDRPLDTLGKERWQCDGARVLRGEDGQA